MNLKLKIKKLRGEDRQYLFAVSYMFFMFLSASALELPEGHYYSKAVSLKYPAKIGIMELEEITDFEKKQKGLGEGLSYRSNDVKADIYIYNMNLEKLPDGCDSEIAALNFDLSEKEIRFLGRRGVYAKLKEKSPKSKISFGDIEYLFEAFSYIESGSAKESFIFLTCFRGNFIKVRLTYNTVPGSDIDVSAYPDFFMKEISGLMKEKKQ